MEQDCTEDGHEGQQIFAICTNEKCRAEKRTMCSLCLQIKHGDCKKQLLYTQQFIDKVTEIKLKTQQDEDHKITSLLAQLTTNSQRFIRAQQVFVNAMISSYDKVNQISRIDNILKKQHHLSINDWNEGYRILNNQLPFHPQDLLEQLSQVQQILGQIEQTVKQAKPVQPVPELGYGSINEQIPLEIEIKPQLLQQQKKQLNDDQISGQHSQAENQTTSSRAALKQVSQKMTSVQLNKEKSQKLVKSDWNRITPQNPLVIEAKHSIATIALSPDGKYIASGGGDGDYQIKIWDPVTGKKIGKGMIGHKDWINQINYSKCGEYIVSGSDDRTIRQWMVSTQQQIGQPMSGHQNIIYGVQYTLDQRYIISCSWDQSIRIWQSETGKEKVQNRIEHPNKICCLSLSPISNDVVFGDWKGIQRFKQIHLQIFWHRRTGFLHPITFQFMLSIFLNKWHHQKLQFYCNNCGYVIFTCWPFKFYQLSSTCADCPLSEFSLPPTQCYLDLVSDICSSNYNRDSTCNCLTGFYNSENSLSCLKCSHICQTCTTSAINCIICNQSLYLQKSPTCSHFISGYFMLYGSCTQCSEVCSTCTQSRTTCLTCTEPYINPPLCSCPDGFFNGCKQQCSVQCQTCTNSSINCLTCSGNRINPPLCGCPDGSPQSTAICEQCSLAKPIARFTDDLTSIEIIFSYKLLSTITCDTLFIQTTLIQIGANPICTANENVITINLGSNPKITVNQPLFISPDKIQFTTCKQSTTNIITPLIQMPLNVLPPTIKFDQDTYIITPCDVLVMNVIGSTFSGSRNLKLVSWNIIEAKNNITLSTLIKQWNSQDLQSSYIISSEYLKNQQSIQLMVIYSNFIGTTSNSSIRIQMKSESLQLSIKVPDKVYVMDTTQIQFVTSLKQCGLQGSSQMMPLNVSLTNSSTTILKNYMVQSDSQEPFTFEPFQLTSLSTYYISVRAQYMNQNIEVQQKFQVVLADIEITILGGDQIIGINQQMKLNAVLLNPNLQTSANDLTYYQARWDCLNLLTNLQCSRFSQNSFNANLSTSDLQPFTTLLIAIQVFEQKQGQQVGQSNVTVKILENEATNTNQINNYDEVDVTITYQKQMNIDVDNLTYYASYLDSSYQQNQIQFYNPQTSIIMQNFNQAKNAKFKVMVYNPVQKGPSVATLNVRLNIPPQQCRISIFPRGSKFQVQINSCISQSQPLQYQFVYYTTQDEFIQDSINGLIINGIKLSDYQIQPTLVTYLYGQNTSLIVGLIKDSSNGLSNTSFSLKNYQTIESSLLYYMLQDSQLNLPRNIMFILKYAQLNNQILSDKYYNQILNISNTFNQTDKITQYIQQQLAFQQSLSNNQISSSISTTSSYINNIQQQLTFLQDQQGSNQYNKNYQFQLITLQNELSDSTTKISFLYAQSQLVQNRRVLDATIKNITSMITETISNVTDILGQFTKVNQNPKTISTPQFNLNAQKFSTSNINQNFKLQVVNQSNQTFSYKNQQFQINPYQNESNFNNTIKAPLIIPIILSLIFWWNQGSMFLSLKHATKNDTMQQFLNIQKIYEKILPKGVQAIVFGRVLFSQEVSTKVQIAE